MTAETVLYEGKAKKILATDSPEYIIQYFKDDATAFNAEKRAVIPGKGIVNNQISARVFSVLAEAGIPTHFVRTVSEREMMAKRVSIIPVEVVIRNRATGSLVARLGLEEGQVLNPPLIELFYKNDALGDPLITEDHIRLLKLADDAQIAEMKRLAQRVNAVLLPFFESRGLLLVDLKLEFGIANGQIVVADEISPDTCRLWDLQSGERLDKDRFRHDLGRVEEAYREVWRRVCA
ncbi:MAG: phosphoribosylaminoimidazolesuccinocarboxamide synthase [Nitrospirae bacterium]|nr:MAG: phosphoribosylaminoimidazolesuccinocarboxamide synthase [Nitrospirota bacterium]